MSSMHRIRSVFRSVPSFPAIVILSVAAAAGYAAFRLHIPLAWILGPMIAVAGAAMCGLPVFAPISGRRFGQLIVGSSVGLNISAAVGLLVLKWLPVMIITALVAVFIAAILSVPFRLLSGLDRVTAYYAMMPGGLSEMASLGAAAGAQEGPIAISQALRVAILVIVLPTLIIALGIRGVETSAAVASGLNLATTLLVLSCSALGVAAIRFARLNNPWMIGALIGSATLASTGQVVGHLAVPLYWLGQFLIGISIGSRFRREIVTRLLRVVIAATFFIVSMIGVLFVCAVGLHWLTGLDLATTTLGASPGGLAEMAITAQTLHLVVGLVMGFHIVRAIIVNGFCTHIYCLLEWSGLFSFIGRCIGSNEESS